MIARTSMVLSMVVVACLARHARAEDVDGMIAVSGTATARDLATISTAVSASARAARWQLPAKPLGKKDIDELARCTSAADIPKCIPPALSQRSVQRAVVVTADKEPSADGSMVIVLVGKLVVAEPPQILVQQRRCGPCTDDTLAAVSTDLSRRLLDELAVRTGRTLVAVSSNPQGASIVLDGDRVGATPMTAKTFPGHHVVELEKPGYTSIRREVDAVEGATVEVAADLQSTQSPTKPGGPEPTPKPAGSTAGWWHVPAGLVVVGGLLATSGGVALYLGQQDGTDDKTRYTRATPVGIGALVLGLGAAGYGAFRLWRGPGVGVAVTPTERGAAIGLAGRF